MPRYAEPAGGDGERSPYSQPDETPASQYVDQSAPASQYVNYHSAAASQYVGYQSAFAPAAGYSQVAEGPAAAPSVPAAGPVVSAYATAETPLGVGAPLDARAPAAPIPAAPVPAAPAPDRTEKRAAAEADAAGVWSKRLPGFYAGEDQDASSFRLGAGHTVDRAWGRHGSPGRHFEQIRTHYMDAGEQAAHQVSVQNGLLTRGGAPLSTQGASGVGTQMRAGESKHIFAMTPGGTVRAAAAWNERQEPQLPSGNYSLDMINHSSLLAGGRAAAAGEIMTSPSGQLQQITDSSGHYQPDSRMTYQAVKHFQDAGVDMHDVSMKLWDKVNNKKHLHASAREFMSYGGDVGAEAAMHARRAAFGADLSQAVGARQARLAQNPADWERVGTGTAPRPAPAPVPLAGAAPAPAAPVPAAPAAPAQVPAAPAAVAPAQAAAPAPQIDSAYVSQSPAQSYTEYRPQ